MKLIYLVKALQLYLAVAVIWLLLGVGQFCGEFEMKANHAVGSHNTSRVNLEDKVKLGISNRAPAKHWATKVNETIQNMRVSSNETKLTHPRDVQKREASQAYGEPEIEETHTTNVTADSTSSVPPTITKKNESTTPETNRFRWHADGCVPVSASDFFNSCPPTHAAKIAKQLSWSVILVSCYIVVVLLQLYLVYASHLPPSNGGDFVRLLIGFILWYVALSNLIYVHYTWKDYWPTANMMVTPGFPESWIVIEMICMIMIASMLFEECCRDACYSNLRIVAGDKTTTRNLQQNVLPTLP